MTLLTWTPFLDPANIFFDWWFLLAPPLALFISMVYKALRLRAYPRYWRHVAVMTIQILLGMMVLQLMLFALVEWVVPAV
jgi:hypothetical protein